MKKITLFLLGFLLSFGTIQAQTWTQIGEDLDAEAAGDYFGASVSLSADGSIMAVGAPWNDENGSKSGQVRVFENFSGSWVQIGDDIDGEEADDLLGASVSLSSDGSIVGIGIWGFENSRGKVKIFENISGTWVQIGQDIDGQAEGDFSGIISLSADGTRIAIGANKYDVGNKNLEGNVRIYEYNAGSWVQLGEDINGQTAGDFSGLHLCLSADGSIVAIGVPLQDDNGTSSGQVRILEYTEGAWIQIGDGINGENSFDQTGTSVSLNSDGSIVAIGAIYNDGNGSDAGHVRIFENISETWTQIGEDIDGDAEGDQFGFTTSINSDGSRVVIGSLFNDEGGSNAGLVKIYENISGTWSQLGETIIGESAGDFSGYDVSMSSNGTIISIGALKNAGSGENAGHVRVYGINEVEVVTIDLTNITATSATANATISYTGAPTFVQHGFCWNTTGSPTLEDNYSEEGSAIAGEFSSEITGLTPYQTYYIKAYVTTDTEIIYGNELSFTTLNNVGVESINQQNISIYPNPTSGFFTIDFHEAGKSYIRITDISGKNILYEKNVDENQIDISNAENGIYFIEIQMDKEIFTTKIIKQ